MTSTSRPQGVQTPTVNSIVPSLTPPTRSEGSSRSLSSERVASHCESCSGTGKRHSIFDFCGCRPGCVANGGQGICGTCDGRGFIRPARVFEVRPYTYTDRGVASLGYELVDDTGTRLGIFDDVPTARIAANSRGADVRLSWEAR